MGLFRKAAPPTNPEAPKTPTSEPTPPPPQAPAPAAPLPPTHPLPPPPLADAIAPTLSPESAPPPTLSTVPAPDAPPATDPAAKPVTDAPAATPAEPSKAPAPPAGPTPPKNEPATPPAPASTVAASAPAAPTPEAPAPAASPPWVKELAEKLAALARVLEVEHQTLKTFTEKVKKIENNVVSLQNLAETLSLRYNPFLTPNPDQEDPRSLEEVLFDPDAPAPPRNGQKPRTAPRDRHTTNGAHPHNGGRTEPDAAPQSTNGHAPAAEPHASPPPAAPPALPPDGEARAGAARPPPDAPRMDARADWGPGGAVLVLPAQAVPGRAPASAPPLADRGPVAVPAFALPRGPAEWNGAAPRAAATAPAWGTRESYLAMAWFDRLARSVDPPSVYPFLDYYRDCGWISEDAYQWFCRLAEGISPRREAEDWNAFFSDPRRLAHVHRGSLRFLDFLFRTHLYKGEADQLEQTVQDLMDER